MKKILVVSDDHNHPEKLEELLKIYPNCDLYLHAGDSQSFETNLFPFITVKGNNDYHIEMKDRIITVDNHKIFLTHGHRYFLSETSMARNAKKNGCDIFIHGHTHRPYFKECDGIYMLCPGSLTYPRTSFGESYALLYIDENNISCEIKKYN